MESQKGHVDYDGGDEEILDFNSEKWRLIQEQSLDGGGLAINQAVHIIKAKCSPAGYSSSSIYMDVIVDDPMDPRFLESSREEIQGLLDRGTYVIVNENDVPPGAIVLKSRVVHAIKKDSSGNEKYKTRLVIQGHLDPEKGKIVNEAPTILRSSTNVILTIAASMNFKIWSRDVKQAFIQSEDSLDRELYVKPPKCPDLLSMINQSSGLLLAVKPLYGLSESPGYWWKTFKRYHITDLGMTQSVLDPCLFFKKIENELIGLIGTLVDDTIGAGCDSFVIEEEAKSSEFDVEPRDESLPFSFREAVISKFLNGFKLSQQQYSEKLHPISPGNFTPKEFAHLRGQLAYVATSTRPDVAYLNAKLAQVVSSKANSSDARLLNIAVKTIKKHPRGLLFPKLNRSKIVVRGYAAASFATNEDHSFQLEMIILLCDDQTTHL